VIQHGGVEYLTAGGKKDAQLVQMRADEGAMRVVLIEAASLLLPALQLRRRGQRSAISMSRPQRPPVRGEGELQMKG